jgi:hypothetical protein
MEDAIEHDRGSGRWASGRSRQRRQARHDRRSSAVVSPREGRHPRHGVASLDLLKLRPVTFFYKPGHDDGTRRLQYGLIAEEVAEIYPELAVLDKDGLPNGVRYHVLPAMLLNEVKKQHAQLSEQAARLEAQQREIDELRAQVRALIGGRAAVWE